MDEHELKFCEKKVTRLNTRLTNITSKTLKKYMFRLVGAVEQKISEIGKASTQYALVLDEWTEDSTHYIGIFVSCLRTDHTAPPYFFLLSISPLLDETNFTATNHGNFIRSTLELFELDEENLFRIIGDNCKTNKLRADLMFVPLLRCN